MNRKFGILLVILLFFLTGCASLSESECRNADWRIIGFEDGAGGRPETNIGRHRTACAKHGVTPDFSTYQKGYSEGIKQYCTPSKGYDAGEKGGYYNGVCSQNPALESQFLKGFEYGRTLHTANSDSKNISSEIQSKKKKIEKIQDEVSRQERLLISDNSTKGQRSILLNEIKESQMKIGELELEIQNLKKRKHYLKIKIDRLNHENPFS